MLGTDIKRVWESFASGSSTCNQTGRSGVEGFVDILEDSLGMRQDENGRLRLFPRASNGDARTRPDHLRFRQLAESIMGPQWCERVNPVNQNMRRNRAVAVFEADGGSAVSPAGFPNVSAFNASISVLMQAKALENYELPGFVGDIIAPTRSTNLRSDRLSGTTELGDNVGTMQPGDPHPSVQFSERFVDTPATEKLGLKIMITKEAIFFEQINGQVMDRAGDVGKILGRRREKRILRQFLGVYDSGAVNDTTKQYKYNGTNFDTYVASGGNWVNDHSNPIVDHTDLNNARQLAYKMTDQETSERIHFLPDTVLCMPAKIDTFLHIRRGTAIERRTASAAEVLHTENLERTQYAWDVFVSSLAHQIATDATAINGLGLSSANADEYWWYFSRSQPSHAYMENWGIDVQNVNTSDAQLVDQGIVAMIVVNEMGAPATIEPRYVIRNKN